MSQQQEFFDPDADRRLFPATTGGAVSDRNFVVTNRSNLIDVLSAGMLRPKDAFEKYYEDSLVLTPGAVPVFRGRAPKSLVARSSVDFGNFPVLVELRPTVVQATADPQLGFVQVESLDAVVSVHLRTEEDLEELTARGYDNVDFGRATFRVTPEVFDGPDVDEQAVSASVESALPSGSEAALGFDLVDRLGGARLLALLAAPASVDALQTIGEVVFQGARRRSRGKAKGVGKWLRVDSSLEKYAPAKSATYDERLFRAAAAVCLAQSRRDVWDGRAVLERVDAILTAEGALSPRELAKWTALSERMSAVLSAASPFTSFKPGPYSSEKALLLLLLRGEVEGVLAWDPSGVVADPWDRTVAALLVGLVHGRTTAPSGRRPAPLDAALVEIERGELLGHTREQLTVVAERQASETEARVGLLVAGQTLVSLELGALTAAQLLEGLDHADPETETALLDVAVGLGWAETIRSTVTFDGGFVQEPTARGSTVRCSGVPRVSSSLDPQVFRERVEANDSAELRDALITAKLARFSTSGGGDGGA